MNKPKRSKKIKGERLIINLTEKERLANHIPEYVWKLSRDNEVFIRDEITGELEQVLDCTGPECKAALSAVEGL